MEDKIIERTTKQNLSFIEQLQSQIQLCREALSNLEVPLLCRVETLEALLWAKLKDDAEYKEAMKRLNEEYENMRKKLKEKTEYWELDDSLVPYVRKKAREQFKAIMIFIDKKGYVPLGNENE